MTTAHKVLMAIAILFTGGTEFQTLNLVRVLVYAGNKITVCCYYEYGESMVCELEMAGQTLSG
jgi:hypothetical protein